MSSPKTAQRLNRILAMLPWVIANPGATVNEVTERFGYNTSELLADLDLVFVCGLPGYGPGDLMSAYVEDDHVVVDMAEYFSRPLRLSPLRPWGSWRPAWPSRARNRHLQPSSVLWRSWRRWCSPAHLTRWRLNSLRNRRHSTCCEAPLLPTPLST